MAGTTEATQISKGLLFKSKEAPFVSRGFHHIQPAIPGKIGGFDNRSFQALKLSQECVGLAALSALELKTSLSKRMPSSTDFSA